MSKKVHHKNVLLDTGPLVAIYCEADKHHEICIEALKAIAPPLITTWPVLTEAAWILRDEKIAVERLYQPEGLFRIAGQGDESLAAFGALYKRYQSLSPQLADMSLIELAETQDFSKLFTLDRRDFAAYRVKRRRLVLLPESL